MIGPQRVEPAALEGEGGRPRRVVRAVDVEAPAARRLQPRRATSAGGEAKKPGGPAGAEPGDAPPRVEEEERRPEAGGRAAGRAAPT